MNRTTVKAFRKAGYEVRQGFTNSGISEYTNALPKGWLYVATTSANPLQVNYACGKAKAVRDILVASGNALETFPIWNDGQTVLADHCEGYVITIATLVKAN